MAPSDNKSLSSLARAKNESNPSQLGDPVSLRAETSDTKPTPDELGAKSDQSDKSLKQRAQAKLQSNPSQLGDPVSLKAETSDTEVTGDDRGARGTSKTSGKPKM